jgi:hypothetical protein
MRTLPQALEILFEMQRKRSNEKIARRKNKLFQLTKRVSFSPLLFGPLLLSNLLTFSFLVHFK